MADNSTLAEIYNGWEIYQGHLVKAIAPLTGEQLVLRAAPNLRSIDTIATHIVRTRASWFYRGLGEGDNEIIAIANWAHDSSRDSAAELVKGLEATWSLITTCLNRWSSADMDQSFEREWQGQTVSISRKWVIWHLIEHDLHHGGEMSFSLGMHGLAAPDL